MSWHFPCLIKVTRGDKSHKMQYFPRRVPNIRWKLTTQNMARLWPTEMSRRVAGCHLSLLLATMENTQVIADAPKSQKKSFKSLPPAPWTLAWMRPFSLTLTKPLKKKVKGGMGEIFIDRHQNLTTNGSNLPQWLNLCEFKGFHSGHLLLWNFAARLAKKTNLGVTGKREEGRRLLNKPQAELKWI